MIDIAIQFIVNINTRTGACGSRKRPLIAFHISQNPLCNPMALRHTTACACNGITWFTFSARLFSNTFHWFWVRTFSQVVTWYFPGLHMHRLKFVLKLCCYWGIEFFIAAPFQCISFIRNSKNKINHNMLCLQCDLKSFLLKCAFLTIARNRINHS